MSTSWGYYCETCSLASPTWFNHGEGLLPMAHDHRAELVAVKRTGESLGSYFDLELQPYLYENRADDEHGLMDFLEAHESHALTLINEYGHKESATFSLLAVVMEGSKCGS